MTCGPDMPSTDSDSHRRGPTPKNIGFYAPNPGSQRSPNVVMGINDDGRIRVFELRTQMVVVLSPEQWMSGADMQASTEAMSQELASILVQPATLDPAKGRQYTERLDAIRFANAYIEKHWRLNQADDDKEGQGPAPSQ